MSRNRKPNKPPPTREAAEFSRRRERPVASREADEHAPIEVSEDDILAVYDLAAEAGEART